MRLCYINDMKGVHINKAIFHCWSHESNIVEPSIRVGGHPGGVIAGTVGIVEYEDGAIHRITPERIQFCDDTSEYFRTEEE